MRWDEMMKKEWMNEKKEWESKWYFIKQGNAACERLWMTNESNAYSASDSIWRQKKEEVKRKIIKHIQTSYKKVL